MVADGGRDRHLLRPTLVADGAVVASFSRRLVALLLGLLLGFGGAEIGARLLVRADADGQRWLGGKKLLPLRLPLGEIARRQGEALSSEAVLLFDPDLGWVPRPGARSEDGRVQIDGVGARSTGRARPGDVPRLVVTVGDSFTFGDEVADAESWPAYLEARLSESGEETGVVNLGVNAYGLDQAVLRFERDGAPLRPDIAILGLQPENLLRALNVVRPIFFAGTDLPFSKPRFVADGDGWVVVNRPALDPGGVLRLLQRPGDHPLLENEFWLDDRYRASVFDASVLASLLRTILSPGGSRPGFEITPEAGALGLHLIERFETSARAVGARPLIVVLPRRDDVAASEFGQTRWYGAWLEEVEHRSPVVSTEDLLAADDGDYLPGGHYTAQANRRIAARIARAIEISSDSPVDADPDRP